MTKYGNPTRTYTSSPDGKRAWPLFEAEYDTSFDVFRADRRKSVIGDPSLCIEAHGLCRMPNVKEAFVGSGKDAYVIYRATAGRPFEHAVHFTIPAQASRVRDKFDVDKSVKTQTIKLRAPTRGRTLDHRAKLGRDRRQAIKNGAPVTRRGKQRKTRIVRLGVARRPRAKVSRILTAADFRRIVPGDVFAAPGMV